MAPCEYLDRSLLSLSLSVASLHFIGVSSKVEENVAAANIILISRVVY